MPDTPDLTHYVKMMVGDLFLQIATLRAEKEVLQQALAEQRIEKKKSPVMKIAK